MSGLADTILKNPLFVFVVVAFGVVVIMNIPAMASFATAIYNGLTTSFEFFPLIALIGALAYIQSRRGK